MRVCEGLCCEVMTRVMLKGGKSWRFAVERGLRERQPLSPLLFNIYLMGMAEELDRAQLGVKLEGCQCGALMMLMMMFCGRFRGRAAGYVECGRGICVKVEDEV